jgi:hypothetical protein
MSDWPEEDDDPPQWRLSTSKGSYQRLTREIGSEPASRNSMMAAWTRYRTGLPQAAPDVLVHSAGVMPSRAG